jgi:hypothetical protein
VYIISKPRSAHHSFSVIDLPYPCYFDDGKQEIKFTDKVLMTNEEFQRFMSSEMGGKGLIWLNYFKEIRDANPEGGDEAASIKKYKG